MIDFELIISNTIAGILLQLPIFFLVFWGVRKIVRELPGWLNIYHNNRMKEFAMERAMQMKISSKEK